MAEIVSRTGADTWVDVDHQHQPHGGANLIRLQAAHRRGLVHIPLTNIRGRTVLSATLTGHVDSGFVDQTVTVKALASWKPAGKATWHNQPGTSGAGVATAVSGLSAGDGAVLGITSLVQNAASGGDYHGFRITTDATDPGESNWRSFNSGKHSWVLTVELSDAIEQPTDLRPSGGYVSLPAPVLSWSYTDLGGTSSEQGAFKVQADPTGNFAAPAFDSGWVTSAVPQYDLAASGFTPLATNGSMQWRVMTRDAAGNPANWSDPAAAITYYPMPTLVVDSPTGGVIGDPTPDVLFHMVGETMTQWRVRILSASNVEKFDSRLSDGDGAVGIPWRDPETDKRVIVRDDATYRFQIRAWGDKDRAVGVGMPAYVEQIVDVVFDDDIGVTTPTDFTVSAFGPGDPRKTFTWFRTEAADAWVLLSDGEHLRRLDAGEVDVDAGTYSWTDNGLGAPYQSHDWSVRAIESGVRSAPSNTVSYTSKPEGVWVIPEDDDPIVLDGTDSIDSFAETEKRVIYPTLTGPDVDVVYDVQGVTGVFQGQLYGGDDGQNVIAAARRLAALREDVSALPQIVFATRSVAAKIRGLSTLPAGEFDDRTLLHNVNFAFQQVDD